MEFRSTASTTTFESLPIITKCKMLVWTFLEMAHFNFTFFPISSFSFIGFSSPLSPSLLYWFRFSE